MLLFLNLCLCDKLTWLLKLITDYESCSFTFVYLYPLDIWAIIFPANRKCDDACHSVTACMLTVQWPDVFVWPHNKLLQLWSLSENWLQVNGLPVCTAVEKVRALQMCVKTKLGQNNLKIAAALKVVQSYRSGQPWNGLSSQVYFICLFFHHSDKSLQISVV